MAYASSSEALQVCSTRGKIRGLRPRQGIGWTFINLPKVFLPWFLLVFILFVWIGFTTGSCDLSDGFISKFTKVLYKNGFHLLVYSIFCDLGSPSTPSRCLIRLVLWSPQLPAQPGTYSNSVVPITMIITTLTWVKLSNIVTNLQSFSFLLSVHNFFIFTFYLHLHLFQLLQLPHLYNSLNC